VLSGEREEHVVSLKGLADLVLREETLAGAMADARGGTVRALDLTAP
jgi:hypothetical protein